MAEKLKLNAQTRELQGKGASRRLRRLEEKVPGIVYGVGEPAMITMLHKEVYKIQENESFYSSILDLDIDGNVESVILKDIQRHPAKALILHVDFQRIDMNKEIQVYVPLHFINEEQCPGVKIGGGSVSHLKTSVEVSCLPNNLPSYIEVDMINVELDQILHISDLTLPEGVTSVSLDQHEHDLAIAQVSVNKRAAAEAEATEAEGDDAAEGDAPAED